MLCLFLVLLFATWLAAPLACAGECSAVIDFGSLPAADQGEGVTQMSLFRVGALKEGRTGEAASDYTALESYAGADGFSRLLAAEKSEDITATLTDPVIASLSAILRDAQGQFPEKDAVATQTVSGGQAVFTGLETGVYLGALTKAPLEVSMTPILFFLQEGGGIHGTAKWSLVTGAAVTKNWQDDANRDGKRPAEIKVALYQKKGTAEESLYQTATDGLHPYVVGLHDGNLSHDTGYVLPKFADDGTAYTYLWHEVKVTDTDAADNNRVTGVTPITPADTDAAVVQAGYSIAESASAFDAEANTWKETITNSRTPETTKLTVIKDWQDKNDQDGVRPADLVVTLKETSRTEGTKTVPGYEEVVLNAANGWRRTTDSLPVYKTKGVGDKITYTWTEPAIKDYSQTGNEVTGEVTTTLTNTHTPEKTSAAVRKIWDDHDNQDGIRPASVTVVLQKKTGGDAAAEDGWADVSPAVSQTLSAANNWTYTKTDLDAYTGGKENHYRWREEALDQVSGHTAYGDPQVSISGTTTLITNPHTPETVEESVVKAWAGENGSTLYRPTSVTVQLSGGTFSQTYTLNSDNNWRATVSGLDKYQNGQEVNYVWTEVQTNTSRYRTTTPVRDAATRTTTITNTYIPRTDITVTKSWSDNNDEDGSRPDTVTVRLLANGSAYGADVTLSASSGKAWTHTWTDLATQDANGSAITYTVQEVKVPTGYKAKVTGSAAAGFVIVNTHTPARGSLRITKNVTLNGAATTGTAVDGTYVFTVKGPNDYSGTVRITVRNGAASSTTITNLPAGTYTVHENVPNGTTLVGENDRQVTVKANNTTNVPEVVFVNNRTQNTPPPETEPTRETNPPTPSTEPSGDRETVTISGQKVWEDESNRHGLRPTSITVRLLANGTALDAQPTWTSTTGNSWSYTFGERPARDSSGRRITYTVEEEAVSGYTTRISGTTITNTLIERTPNNYTTIDGTKSWADNANALGDRPNMITVRLLRDGVESESRTVTAATGWTYSFQNLPMDDGYGHNYTYSIREDGVSGYFARMNGNDITNNLIPIRTIGGDVPGETPSVPGSPQVDNPVLRQRVTEIPPFGELTEENLEDLLDLFDYNTPLFGMLLGTGDEMPIYPFIFGGIGTVAVILLFVTGRRRRKEEAKA